MHRFVVLLMLAAVIGALAAAPGAPWRTARAEDGPVSMVVEPQLDGSQFVTVVFHALDRDGFCQPPPGAVSLHPVLNMPVDFIIEAGDGIIIETSSGGIAPGRQATGVRTFSTAANAAAGSPVRSFPPLRDGVADECQAWVRISQSIPGPLRVLDGRGRPGDRDDGAAPVPVDAGDLDRPGDSARAGAPGRERRAGDRHLRMGDGEPGVAGVLPGGGECARGEHAHVARAGEGILGRHRRTGRRLLADALGPLTLVSARR